METSAFAQPFGHCDSFETVGRFAYNLEIRLILKKRNDATPNYFMVIYNEDAEHTTLHRGILMRIELVPSRDNDLIGDSNRTTEPECSVRPELRQLAELPPAVPLKMSSL